MSRSTARMGFAILLVAACATSPSSPPARSGAVPTPSVGATPATPTSSVLPLGPTPTPGSAVSGWPYSLESWSEPTFAPDGTAYFLVRDPRDEARTNLLALDTGGHPKPGWPVKPAAGSDLSPFALGPDGSVYLEERGNLAIGNVFHRLGADGRDLPGWPFKVPSDFTCPTGPDFETDDPRTPTPNDPCYPLTVTVALNGTAYLTSPRTGGVQLIAIDPSGVVKPGWPIALDDRDWYHQQLGPDGTMYLVGRPTGTPRWDPVKGVIDNDAQLWAYGPNGRLRSGWPIPVPNIDGFLIDPLGDIVVRSLVDDIGELCRSPRRTVYTIVGPDGRTRHGWPRGSTGFASIPVVDAVGTLYYISATDKLYAHDRAGEVKSGWPVTVPGAGGGCGPESPYLAPDGTLYAMGDEVVAVSSDGRSPAGWPYRAAGSQPGPCFDSECFGGHVAPAFGRDGTVYLLVYQPDSGGVRAEIVALDRDGQPEAGWPYRLPFDANTVAIYSPSVSPDGRVIVRTGSAPYQLLAIDPDGRVSR